MVTGPSCCLNNPPCWQSHGRTAHSRLQPVQASSSGRYGGSSGSSGSSSGASGGAGSSGSSGKRRYRKARQPGLYEVLDISPPQQSLGIHALPANTGNGDWVEVEGSNYVVQSVVMQYKLVRGRYKRDHQRLEVQQTGRFLTELFLEDMLQLDAPSEGKQ